MTAGGHARAAWWHRRLPAILAVVVGVGLALLLTGAPRSMQEMATPQPPVPLPRVAPVPLDAPTLPSTPNPGALQGTEEVTRAFGRIEERCGAPLPYTCLEGLCATLVRRRGDLGILLDNPRLIVPLVAMRTGLPDPTRCVDAHRERDQAWHGVGLFKGTSEAEFDGQSVVCVLRSPTLPTADDVLRHCNRLAHDDIGVDDLFDEAVVSSVP